MRMKNSRVNKLAAVSIFALALGVSGMTSAFAQDAQAPNSAATAPIGTPNSLNLSEGAEEAVKQAFHGTVDAAKDTGLTTEVKTSLLADKVTQHSTIHVKTRDAIVTLTGKVDSMEIARRAQQVAEGVNGVQLVRNELKIAPSRSARGTIPEATTTKAN